MGIAGEEAFQITPIVLEENRKYGGCKALSGRVIFRNVIDEEGSAGRLGISIASDDDFPDRRYQQA